MISPRLYETLDQKERQLWHSHVFEVKSGMLVMPQSTLPSAAWEAAENKEVRLYCYCARTLTAALKHTLTYSCTQMETVVHLYGKVWNLWQPEDMLPIGEPKLMTSFLSKDQFDFEKVVSDRDQRFGVDHKKKAKAREYIQEPEIHPGKFCCLMRIGQFVLTQLRCRCCLGKVRY